MKNKLLSILLLLPCVTLFAQQNDSLAAKPCPNDMSLKVITRSHMLGIGGTKVLDTYLSDEHFSGIGFSFLATVERQRPTRRWSTLMEHEANFSFVKDRVRSKQELEGAYNFYWGKFYAWHLFDRRLKLQAGGLVNVSAGFIYNTANSNNPAQARLHLNLMPTGIATYHFQLFRRSVAARYSLRCHWLASCSRPTTDSPTTKYSHAATTTTTSCPPPLSRLPSGATC